MRRAARHLHHAAPVEPGHLARLEHAELARPERVLGLGALLVRHLLHQRHLLGRQQLAPLHQLGERRGALPLLLATDRRAEGGQLLCVEEVTLRHLLAHRRHRTVVGRDGRERETEPPLVGEAVREDRVLPRQQHRVRRACRELHHVQPVGGHRRQRRRRVAIERVADAEAAGVALAPGEHLEQLRARVLPRRDRVPPAARYLSPADHRRVVIVVVHVLGQLARQRGVARHPLLARRRCLHAASAARRGLPPTRVRRRRRLLLLLGRMLWVVGLWRQRHLLRVVLPARLLVEAHRLHDSVHRSVVADAALPHAVVAPAEQPAVGRDRRRVRVAARELGHVQAD